jgi:hypothetical protein
MRFDASPAPLTERAAEDLIRFFQGFDLHAKSVTFLREEDVSPLASHPLILPLFL